MPGTIDGLQLAKLVRTEFPQVAISITSGSSEALRAARDLIDPHLVFPKPFDPRQVSAIFVGLLGPERPVNDTRAG